MKFESYGRTDNQLHRLFACRNGVRRRIGDRLRRGKGAEVTPKERQQLAIKRVRLYFNDPEPQRMSTAQALLKIKAGELCIIATDRLIALLDELDRLESAKVQGDREQTTMFETGPEYE